MKNAFRRLFAAALLPLLAAAAPVSLLAAAASVSLLAAAASGPRIEPGPPVLRVDFPDPFLLAADGRLFAFATNRRGGPNVQLAVSDDMRRWRRLKADALPTLPPWARPGFTWAPEAIALDGGYRLYFTARHRASGLQCIGVGVSSLPQGPYRSAAAEPLVCQQALGGSIDPSPFRDADGALVLHFKNDGNHVGQPTFLYAQRLSADGMAVEGAAVPLLTNDQRWEGQVVEAPTMVRRGGAYALFFSANDYGWPPGARASPYAMGVAYCRTAMGPCEDAPDNPVLASGAGGRCLSGPGHQSVLEWKGESWIAYHAWETGEGCAPGARRRLFHIGRLRWP